MVEPVESDQAVHGRHDRAQHIDIVDPAVVLRDVGAVRLTADGRRHDDPGIARQTERRVLQDARVERRARRAIARRPVVIPPQYVVWHHGVASRTYPRSAHEIPPW
jgi:hypothetical protein